jgi:hypothetical protein
VPSLPRVTAADVVAFRMMRMLRSPSSFPPGLVRNISILLDPLNFSEIIEKKKENVTITSGSVCRGSFSRLSRLCNHVIETGAVPV